MDLPDGSAHSSRPGTWWSGCRRRCCVVAAAACSPATAGTSRSKGSRRKPTLLATRPGVALAAIGSLAFGAVLGPEAPLIALGSVVGVAMARLLRAKARGQRGALRRGLVLRDLGAVRRPAGRRRADGRGRRRAGRGADPGAAARARGRGGRLRDLRRPRRLGWPRPRGPRRRRTCRAYKGTHVNDLLLAVAVGIVTVAAHRSWSARAPRGDAPRDRAARDDRAAARRRPRGRRARHGRPARARTPRTCSSRARRRCRTWSARTRRGSSWCCWWRRRWPTRSASAAASAAGRSSPRSSSASRSRRAGRAGSTSRRRSRWPSAPPPAWPP